MNTEVRDVGYGTSGGKDRSGSKERKKKKKSK
jgi:hypothetical protein